MNTYFSQEYTRHHQAGLLLEADRSRLAKIAKEARLQSTPDPKWGGKGRLVMALSGAAAAIVATASAVLAGV